MTVIDPAIVADRIAQVRSRLSELGSGARLIAVTKGFGVDAIEAAVAEGVVDIGESYADEFRRKAELAPPAVRWHFIGRLQRNKVRQLGATVDLWHSIDRDRLVDEVAKRAPGASILVQVDTTGEVTKGGCSVGETPRLVARAQAAGLDVQGLMTMGPTGGEARATAAAFATLDGLASAEGLPERSMGMSGDWELAVDHGATMIRLGSSLFGPRPDRTSG